MARALLPEIRFMFVLCSFADTLSGIALTVQSTLPGTALVWRSHTSLWVLVDQRCLWLTLELVHIREVVGDGYKNAEGKSDERTGFVLYLRQMSSTCLPAREQVPGAMIIPLTYSTPLKVAVDNFFLSWMLPDALKKSGHTAHQVQGFLLGVRDVLQRDHLRALVLFQALSAQPFEEGMNVNHIVLGLLRPHELRQMSLRG